MTVTRKDVERCYRILLGRDPESKAVVDAAVGWRKPLWQLFEDVVRSPEYRQRIACGTRPLAVDVPGRQVDVEVGAPELEVLIAYVRQSWEHLGREGAHFSVLTDDRFLPTTFADNAAEFWASGEGQIDWLARILDRHGLTDLGDRICIDFGCGVGRLTEPLAGRFRHVHGYDISQPHLDVAGTRLRDRRNVQLHLVRQFPVSLARADVFFSLIVLQHNPPPIIALLISSALECLKPGGIAVFQVPTYAIDYSFVVSDYLRRLRTSKPGMEMHCIPQHHVFRIAAEAGCRLLEVREQDMTGRFGSDVSNVFVIQKPT